MTRKSPHERARLLFEQALELPTGEREAFLDAHCGNDAGLHHELESLLATEVEMGSFLAPRELGAMAAAMLPGAVDPLVGQTLGRYRVGEVLGRGGMGVVYRAEQKNPDRQVALKVMAHGLLSSGAIRRFEVEVQILGRLQHPGIAQIFEAGTENTAQGARPFFAMEFIDGLPLTTWAQEQDLDLPQRLDLMVKICAGVQHAHQKGVIHRDLKPANILVDRSGQPRILDFGVARSIDADLQMTTMAEGSGGLLGTLAYMSPEQVQGNADLLDTRSDVYALGVVCYELLTGHHPHDLKGKSITEAIRIISEAHPATLAQAGATVPTDVETIVAKALVTDPAQRYESASALGADLERFLENRPILAHPPRALYHLRKLIDRNRLASGLAATLAVLILVGAAAMVTQNQRIRIERDLAAREARTAGEVSQFLQSLFEVSDPRVAQGNEPTARELLDRGAEQIEHNLSDQPVVQTRLLILMGNTYRGLGLLDEAQQHLERSVELARTIVADEPALMHQALQGLARLYSANARITEGVDLAREAVMVAETHLGTNDPLRGQSLTTLGALLRDDGKWDEARQVLERAHAFCQKVHGADSYEAAIALNQMAWLEHRLGRDQVAAPIYEQTCAILEQVLEPNHPELASCYNDHSTTLDFLGRYEEAGKLLRQSIAIKELILPPGHPDLALAVNNLGAQYWRAGDYEKAILQYRHALAMRAEALGQEHPDVGGTMCNIAMVQRDMRQWGVAEATFKDCIAHLEAATGPDDRRVSNGLMNLAELYRDTGRLPDALAIYQRLLASRERTHGRSHLWFAGALRNRGRMLMWLKRLPEAEADLRQAVAIVAPARSLEVPGRAMFDIYLAEALTLQGQTDEARAILTSVRDAQKEVDPNQAMAECLFALARIARIEDDVDTAQTLLESAIQVWQQSRPAGDHDLLYTQAVALALRGDRQGALAALRDALASGFPYFAVDTEIDLASLRGDSDFRALLAEYTPAP